MNRQNLNFSTTPWLDNAAALWELWRAGNDWAARVGWFQPLPTVFNALAPPLPKEPDRTEPARDYDLD